MGVRKALVTALFGAGVALGSQGALASHVPGFSFTAEPFCINPGAVGEGGATTCGLRFMDFSYGAEADQTGFTFDETGGGFFSSFKTSLSGAPVGGTGLTTDYNLYFLFSGNGTITPNPAPGADGTFTSFDFSIFVDTNQDTTLTEPAPGLPDESVTVAAGGDEDIVVLTGTLVVGGFHLFPNLVSGDFDVLLTASNCGLPGFFDLPGDDCIALAEVAGNNREIIGAVLPGPTVVATDIIINGSGQAAFQDVPEPMTLLLLASGLLLLGGFRRLR